MNMEILLEPNIISKLLDSIQAGNPVKEILFKLNLPDNRVDPHEFEGILKDGCGRILRTSLAAGTRLLLSRILSFHQWLIPFPQSSLGAKGGLLLGSRV
ncbi:hypothetical protein Tco_0038458 [Tanacetum coccineum]